MPVTQRFVHGGLCLVAAVTTLCVIVLVLGAARSTVNHAGLPGSPAPTFALRDTAGQWGGLATEKDKLTLLLITPAEADKASLQPDQLHQVTEVFESDPDVSLLGIQYASDDVATQAAEQLTRGANRLAETCPSLRVLNDVDRSVARAFRVIDGQPTFFVIDAKGVIRGRIPLNDSAAIAVTETITSLKAPSAPRPPLAPSAS